MNDRCPYGSGKLTSLALSSSHPPDTSIAVDSQCVSFTTFIACAVYGGAVPPTTSPLDLSIIQKVFPDPEEPQRT